MALMLAIQGHPEFDVSFEKTLLGLKKEDIPPAMMTKAVKIKSLGKKDDTPVMAEWMVRFIRP